MTWWAWALVGIYLSGFAIILFFHVTQLQMVTFPLALLRAGLWPLWLFIGFPRGVPLTMD